jgi:hypothetical protein
VAGGGVVCCAAKRDPCGVRAPDAGVGEVEPVGDLPVGDDVDVPHPGRVLLHGAQGVPQLLRHRPPVIEHQHTLPRTKRGMGRWQLAGRQAGRQASGRAGR